MTPLRRALALAGLASACASPPSTAARGADAAAPVVRDAAGDVATDPAPLAPLPLHTSGGASRFLTFDHCDTCHAVRGRALLDAAGRDVSPSRLWGRSMMALSARDPYWLAAFSVEREENPAAVEHVERTCTRCHAPAGATARADSGAHLRLRDITEDDGPVGQLAREGVGCALCHQLAPEGLDDEARFSGNYLLNTQRLIYGPHPDPVTAPMQTWVDYTPTRSDHTRQSALCASCHTVLTRALDGDGRPSGPLFPEQVPYLEWRGSDYRDGGDRATTCQGCHMPTRDEDGAAIATTLSGRYGGLAVRTPIHRHEFWGGNAYMLRLIAANAGWARAPVATSDLEEGARLTERNVRAAATLRITELRRDGDALALRVRVTNEAGHKFPTAYPTRRAWLHVRVLDAAGTALFESGRSDASGALVDASGRRIDTEVVAPQRGLITQERDVQTWEAVPLDAAGRVTHQLLRAVRWGRDNRILPRGWSPTHPDARWTAPVGVEGDTDFVPGSDDVSYRIALAGRAPASVEVALRFQAVTPAAVDALAASRTPESLRFVAMARAMPPASVEVATARAAVPR